MRRLIITVLVALVLPMVTAATSAAADLSPVYPTPALLKSEAASAEDLKLPAKASSLGMSSSLYNGFFKPDGDGPFPALVLLHSCGGIREDMRTWAKAALKLGYVVVVPDSMRGAKMNCFPPLPVNNGRRVKDALDAAAHVGRQPFVDPARIYALGFSQGTHVAELLAAPALAAALSAPGAPRFAATAGLYGACGRDPVPPTLPAQVEYLQPDIDRPLLLLLAEGDNETPASFCLGRLPKLKESGRPVEWHVYPDNVTHCWDCSTLNGQVKTDWRGSRVVYHYNDQVTEDSRKRVFEFFSRHGGAKP